MPKLLSFLLSVCTDWFQSTQTELAHQIMQLEHFLFIPKLLSLVQFPNSQQHICTQPPRLPLRLFSRKICVEDLLVLMPTFETAFLSGIEMAKKVGLRLILLACLVSFPGKLVQPSESPSSNYSNDTKVDLIFPQQIGFICVKFEEKKGNMLIIK